MHSRSLPSVFSAFLLLTGLFAVFSLTVQAQDEKNTPTKKIRKTNVELLELTPQTLSVQKSYVGSLHPYRRVTVSSENEGVLEAVYFEKGDLVKSGKKLVHVSTKELTVRRDINKADLELAQSNYKRDKELFDKKLIPPSQLDQTRHQLNTAVQQLKLAEIELKRSAARSPISGVVHAKLVEKGEFVNRGQAIAEILEVQKMKVTVPVPEQDIPILQMGQMGQISFYAYPEREFSGTIRHISAEADAQNRSFPVELEVDNSKQELRAGMLARVHFQLADYENQIVIPRHTVLERIDGKVVFVVGSEVAEERRIEVGESEENRVHVTKGLRLGERIVNKGQQQLNDGALVEVLTINRQPTKSSESESGQPSDSGEGT